MIILVCGLSRSGKSSMIAALAAEDPSVQHVSASRLLREAGRPIRHISKSDAILNQEILAVAVSRQSYAGSSFVLIDGHILLETTSGPYLLDDAVLDSFAIEGIVFIHANQQDVTNRRSGTDIEITPHKARELMELEGARAEEHARQRQIPFEKVSSGDIQGLKQKLREMFKNKACGEAHR